MQVAATGGTAVPARCAGRLLAAFALLCACLLLVPAVAHADEDAPALGVGGPSVQAEEAVAAPDDEADAPGAPEGGPEELAGTSGEALPAGEFGGVVDKTPEGTMSALAEGDAQAGQEAAVADGVYTFATALDAGKCLDVPGASTANGAALQLYSQNATPAQRWSVRALGESLYEIVNVGSGKALDVAAAQKASGAAVQQYDRNSTAAQKWKLVAAGSGLYKLVSALSDSLVLDVAGASRVDGARVQLWSDNGTEAQLWQLVAAQAIDDGFYAMRNSGSGKALDVAGGSVASGANVQQYAPNDTFAQTFQMAYDRSNGYYTVTDAGSGKVLDVAAGSSAPGANVQQYAANGTRAQKWAVVANGDGTFTLRSSVSGLALDVSGASSADGANVQVWNSNGTGAQKWALSPVADWLPEGTYNVLAAVNPENAVDIAGGAPADGSNVQVYRSNGTNAQRYYLRPAGGGCYTLQNPSSGKYLSASGSNVVLGSDPMPFEVDFGAGGMTLRQRDGAGFVLDVEGASKASGANLQLYEANGSLAQRFLARPCAMFSDEAYSIRYAADTDFVIDVPGASGSSGTQMQLYRGNGTTAQSFRFTRISGDVYRIVSSCSGKALQAVRTDDGSYALQQRDSGDSDDQRWRLSLAVDGPMQLFSSAYPDMCVDLSGNAVQDGTPIVVYGSNGTAAQKWKLVWAGDAKQAGATTYDTLGLTLRRMAELQKSSPYNDDYTVEQLMDLLDPDKLDMTQFLDVRVTTGVTAAQLDSFIVSTSTGQSGVLKGLGSSFASAAGQYGLNEVYLLAHAILESGWGTSTLARGYRYEGGDIDGTHYDAGTYYNFYGIGAYDSSPLSGGRKLAIVNGWNTPEKAVTGAAKWIADNYAHAGSYAQPTLYAMKWDYARSNATGELGWHQYATGTSWPASIASLVNQCYSTVGGNGSAVYIVPKYR